MPLPLIPIAIGIPVLGVWGVIARVIGQDWPKLRNMFFFPLGGTSRGPHHAAQRQLVLRRLNGQPVRLVTHDKRAISAVWAEPAQPARADVAVIILGANAMVLDDLVEYAEWYLRRLRVPVLLVNLWGYPDPLNPATPPQLSGAAARALADEAAPPQPSSTSSEAAAAAAAAILSGDSGADAPSLCPTELSAYLDAEAAYTYLAHDRLLAPTGILVHGISIGGAIGAAVALNHPGVRLTLDQPFCTLKEVTHHMTHGVVESTVTRFLHGKGWLRTMRVARACITPAVSRAVAFLLVRMCFKRGLGGTQAGCAPTDLLDTVGKAARIEGDVFVLYAAADEMMHPDAPRRILSARYGARTRADADAQLRRRSAPMEGGHMSFFGDHAGACELYMRNLRETAFLSGGGGARGDSSAAGAVAADSGKEREDAPLLALKDEL